MIIEINYLTIALLGALLSAFVAGLWAVGRTFLQQYGQMLTTQMQAFEAREAKTTADVARRIDRLESDILGMAKKVGDLEDVSTKALTHKDLDDLYVKINTTSREVAEMKGVVTSLNDNLRMLLNRITEKGLD